MTCLSFLTFYVKRLHHIMIDEFKIFMTDPVLHVPFSPCEEVVDDGHLVAIHHQLVCQMGAHETSPSCDLEGKQPQCPVMSLLIS